jgi:hypothetical protein
MAPTQRDYFDQQSMRPQQFQTKPMADPRQRGFSQGPPQGFSPPQQAPQQAPQQPGGQGFNMANMPSLNLPDFTGIQAGGGTNIEGVGSVTAGNQVPLAQTIVGALSDAFGQQLGLQGSLANTAGGVEQARIGAGANMYGADQALAGQLGTAGIDAGVRELIARLQNELGIYQTDIGAETSRYGADATRDASMYGSDAQLAAAQAAANAGMYGSDQDRIARLGVAELANVPAQLANDRAVSFGQPLMQQLVQQMFGGGTATGLQGTSVPGLDLNRAYANNAAQEAAALNSGGYSGGSPQAGAASQAAGLNRAMADTGAEVEYAREARQAQLDAIAAESDRMRAQAAQYSPVLQLLQGYV